MLTLAMAIFFSRSITQRLRILGDNALRVARKEPLHKPVSGGDEIASLDRIFREMAEALAKSDRQKQEFVNMITHDLRTPLTSLQGNIALLLEGHYGVLSEKAQERLNIAEHSATRLINLITELLDIERIEAGMFVLSIQEVQLSDVIHEAVVSIQSFAEQKHISIEVSSDDQRISADPTRLVQVLVNLLSNAIKFSPPDAVVTIGVERNGPSITIRISDNGPGMVPEDLTRVFDRFQQAQNTSASKMAGSGLGLAICKAIMTAHGGRIGVESQLAKGSTFWIELPVKAAAAVSSTV
jgi:signal transduction histidine kinase